MSRLEDALRGDWLHWHGLDPGLTAPALVQALGPGTAPGPRHPARLSLQLVQGQEYERSSPPELVRAWFDGQSDDVLLVELDEPPSLVPLVEILAAWGPPDRSGPGRRPVIGALPTAHVYLARGAVLTVAESYEEPPEFSPRLARAQLFVPTDLQDFIVRL